MDRHDDPSAPQPGDQHGEAVARGDERWGGATEQVEDYLRLEEHIEQLQADRRPRRPRRLPPDQARVYQMAAFFRAAAPGAAQPDPDFAARLRERLEREVGGNASTRRATRGPSISRRGLLAGGLTAAAAAAGLAAGVAIERPQSPASSPTAWNVPLVGASGAWVAVAAVDDIPVGGVRRFVTDQVAGFVRHTASGFVALSGACTHMGCLVSWNGTSRTFDCPCHGGRFQEDGRAAPSSPVAYRPLPAIQTKVDGGQVWVFLPSPATDVSTSTSSGSNPYQRHAPGTPSS
jgi:cytochrome b6-f complex iron-sulfur subunit